MDHTLGNKTFIITATPIVASNGVVVIIDGVLLPAWLPPAKSPIRPAPPANNEPFVFRAVNHARRDCGQVDAASSVPPAIYDDEGKLKRYIELTIEHFSMPDGLQLELGTCAATAEARRPPETIVWTTLSRPFHLLLRCRLQLRHRVLPGGAAAGQTGLRHM